MRKWLEFNLTYPKTVLGILVIITLFSIYGLSKTHFDSSSESLMPKDDPIYKIGQQAKIAFGDNKTFMIGSIEAIEGNRLFSKKTFEHIYVMVRELEEYNEFDQNKEDARLNALLDAGGAVAAGEAAAKTAGAGENNQQLNTDMGIDEAALDEAILGGGDAADAMAALGEKKKGAQSKAAKQAPVTVTSETSAEEAALDAAILGGEGNAEDVLKQMGSQPAGAGTEPVEIHEENPHLLTDFGAKLKDGQIDPSFYNKPHRERVEYSYDNYKPVSLASLRSVLGAVDADALLTLDTIIKARDITTDGDDYPLSKRQYALIVESWEDLYLYKSLEIIDSLIDPITVEDMVGSKTELKPVDIVAEDDSGRRILPVSAKDFELYKKRILKNPAFDSTLYSLDEQGKIRALGLSIKLATQKKYDDYMNYLWPMVKKYDTSPIDIHLMGSTVFDKFMSDYQQRDLGVFMPLVVLVIIITFYLNFRSVRGVLLPTITVVTGSIWTIGLMGHLGVKLTMIGNILPPLMIAIGSSYSIHIFNQYLIELEYIHAGDKKQRLLDIMLHISTTVFLAGFTTFVSFMTLTVNQVTGLREFGIFAAIGSGFAVVIAVMLIPSSLMIMKILPMRKGSLPETPAGSPEHVEPGLEDFDSGYKGNAFVQAIIRTVSIVSIRHSGKVLIISLIILLFTGFGITRLETETAPTKFFKEGSEIRQIIARIGEVFNGSMILNLVIDSGETNGVKKVEFLNYIEGIRSWLDKDEQRDNYNLLHNTAFPDFIKRMHMAMNEDKDAFFKVPASTTTVTDYLEIFSGDDKDSDGRPDAFESTIDNQYRRTNVIIRLGERNGVTLGTAMSRKARNAVLDFMQKYPNPHDYKYNVVGEPVNFVVLGDYIVKGQILSIILSIFIVGLVIFLLFKNHRAGLVALVPIASTIGVVFGVMGYLDIPLDIAKAILSSIAIGIGVDDTIHFLNTLRKERRDGLGITEALQATHRMAGLAIVYTSIALIFGFAVMLFSSFTPIFHFGFLVSSVMAVTTIAALVVLPSVINKFQLDISIESKARIFNYINLSRFLE